MQKKVVIGGAVLMIVVFGGGLWWFGRQKTAGEVQTPASTQGGGTIPTAGGEKVLVWDDPAGFTFEYPQSAVIDSHPDDKVNYANITLKLKNEPGVIWILAADTKEKSIDDWAKKDRRSQLTGGGGQISLGGKPARKLIFADEGKILVAAIDEGVLFTLDLSGDKSEAIEKVFNQIVSSFKFVYPETPSEAGDIIEEEEIIE